MTAKRVDSNQAAIVKELRQHEGITVQSLATIGKGFPDIIVGHEGVNYLFEIKSAKGKLTADQVVWHRQWCGQAMIVTSAEEIFDILGIAKC